MKFWTVTEDELLRALRGEGVTHHEIARRMGRSSSSVECRARVLLESGILPAYVRLYRSSSTRRYENGAVPQNNERPMPFIPDVDGPSYCATCKQKVHNWVDRDGYATVECGCGTRFAPVIRNAPKISRNGNQVGRAGRKLKRKRAA